MKKINSDEIINLRKNGKTYKEICEITGVSKASVSKYCRGLNENFLIYEKIIKIEQSKIDEAQKIYDDGKTLREVSKIIGVSRQTLSKYLSIRNKRFRTKDELKEMSKKRVGNWKRKQKEKFVNLFGGRCQVCGYDKSMRSLHFHHLDPNKKEIGISSGEVSIEKLKDELKKCILVCSNCHCEIHDELFENNNISKIVENIINI